MCIVVLQRHCAAEICGMCSSHHSQDPPSADELPEDADGDIEALLEADEEEGSKIHQVQLAIYASLRLERV